MTFTESVRLNMGPKYLFKLAGRATRSEYWWFIAFTILVAIILEILDAFFPPVVSMILNLAVWLALLPPSLGVSVRRLHDLNFSGWWLLTPFICGILSYMALFGSSLELFYILVALTLVSELCLLIACVLPGPRWPNRFGPPEAGMIKY